MAILVHFGPFLGLGGVFFLAENFFLGTHLSFMTLLNGFFTLWSNPREKVENLQISSPPTIGPLVDRSPFYFRELGLFCETDGLMNISPLTLINLN